MHPSLISFALMIMVGISWSKSLLGMKRVHQYCPETKAQSMAWKHPGSPTFKKFKTSTSSGKVMATVFWDMHGVLLLHFSPPNETVNSAAYQATLTFNARGLRCQTRGCCCCMTKPDLTYSSCDSESFWDDGAGKFLSTRPTVRIWHLQTFISSPT